MFEIHSVRVQVLSKCGLRYFSRVAATDLDHPVRFEMPNEIVQHIGISTFKHSIADMKSVLIASLFPIECDQFFPIVELAQ